MDLEGLIVQPQPPPTALTTPSMSAMPVAVASDTTAILIEFEDPPVSLSSLTPSEMGDSESERASPDFTTSPSFHTPKPSQTPKKPVEKTPARKAKTLIDLPLDVLKDIVKEVCISRYPNVLISLLTLVTQPRLIIRTTLYPSPSHAIVCIPLRSPISIPVLILFGQIAIQWETALVLMLLHMALLPL